ncbi:Polyisoprenoid-binding protein YceI [Enhydrobacter aerosaccus]|uniref:Polyisoprenoid-binding protein YceI n=1 Tax=Enhydrobacter aerosaccus TaxID=225324 RepID=A0A1T4KNI8_9HYPH|nr:YceI family protein [Enhydrobacter aerosaccus]SJZ43970.1 Polyisoprenoid-binding protein YceI [Enhydrobacter aerosaccus]
MPFDRNPKLGRRRLLTGVVGGAVLALLPSFPALAMEQLRIGGERGTIDFSIGDSAIFRTTGSFKDWRGMLNVDESNVRASSVSVEVNTKSIEMLDLQQTTMLKDSDFFDVDKFPEMIFRSRTVERTGESTLKVIGDVTLRGITRPMVLNISVTDRQPNAPAGTRYARFRGEGKINRSEFGMTKYVDVVGDTVDITIRADAWR